MTGLWGPYWVVGKYCRETTASYFAWKCMSIFQLQSQFLSTGTQVILEKFGCTFCDSMMICNVPTPAALMYPHTMMEPPPCFTVGTGLCDCISLFFCGHTVGWPLDPNMLNLLSSKNMTWFQKSPVCAAGQNQAASNGLPYSPKISSERLHDILTSCRFRIPAH